ncbi:MAG: radical SAM protein [Deltaproteobacteria bacterium]|nr:radical SAM protein [Deltaproteobacteria bacterium]
MKVLLISAQTEQSSLPVLPMGLACVAAAAEKAGHDVTLLDLKPEAAAEAVVREAIVAVRPSCIGLSVRNIDDQRMAAPRFLLARLQEVAAACRSHSSAPLVLGGAGYSLFPESVLTYLDADLGIEGEGEVAFPALLARLEAGLDGSGIAGVHSRSGGRPRPREMAARLDDLPLPAPGIFSAAAAGGREAWIPVQTRRGCPLNCSYCSTPRIEGTLVRKRSPERFAAWLEPWAAAGYENFFFVDNTFNLPPDYAKELCRRILERGLHLRLHGIVYPQHVDRELVELMAEAGCRQISLGFESGSAPILRNFNKRFSPPEIRAAAALFAACGIERQGFLLLGGPGETRESVEESLAFAESLELETLRLTAGVRIYPDTPLAEISRRQGLIAPADDLLRPRFYLAPGLEGWLLERLREWAASRPWTIL